jgi:hypothetical protein
MDQNKDIKPFRSLKCIRQQSGSPIPKTDIEIISLSSDDESASTILDENHPLSQWQHVVARQDTLSISSDGDSISSYILYKPPSSLWPATDDIRSKILRAIRHLRKDPSMTERPAQMDALIAICEKPNDLIIVMKTGSGKSML